jgi:hypothetical protein
MKKVYNLPPTEGQVGRVDTLNCPSFLICDGLNPMDLSDAWEIYQSLAAVTHSQPLSGFAEDFFYPA